MIVTKNEEKTVADALRSVKDFGEIIVVDDFSSDKTCEIAREFTDKVFQLRWQGYAKQKQAGIDRASLPWVLILDSDERLTDELSQEISMAISDPAYSGYYIPRRNYFLNKWIRHGGWWPDYTLRLFRRDSGRMEDREVHEKIVVDGKAGYLGNHMEHYTYASISDYIRKMDNYSGLAAKEMEKEGRASGLLPVFCRPPATFLRMFLLQQGFRDGFHGLVLALLYSFYTFLKYLKLWELQKGERSC